MRGRVRFNGGPLNLEVLFVDNIFEPIRVPIPVDQPAVVGGPVEAFVRAGEYRIDERARRDILRWLSLKDRGLIPWGSQLPYSAVPVLYEGEV